MCSSPCCPNAPGLAYPFGVRSLGHVCLHVHVRFTRPALLDADLVVVVQNQVTVSSSQSGRQARVRAVLRETGHLVGIRVPQPDCDFRCVTDACNNRLAFPSYFWLYCHDSLPFRWNMTWSMVRLLLQGVLFSMVVGSAAGPT